MDAEQAAAMFERWCSEHGFPFRRMGVGQFRASVSMREIGWSLVCEIQGCGVRFWSLLPVEITPGNCKEIRRYINQTNRGPSHQRLGLDPVLGQIRCGDCTAIHIGTAAPSAMCDKLFANLAAAADHLAVLRRLADDSALCRASARAHAVQ